MRIIGAVLVMVASCGIGFLFAAEVSKRRKELEEQYSLMRLLLGDIRYMRDSFPEAIRKEMLRHKGSYDSFLNAVSERLCEAAGQSFAEIWRTAVESELQQSALTEADKQRMKYFGESITYTDRENVMMCFEHYLEELKEEIDGTNRVAGTKMKLYRSLGVLAGVFIIVLFI